MPESMNEQGNILRFWRDVEVFNIPAPPTYNDVKQYEESEPLPWLADVPEGKSVFHTIYLAVEDNLFLSQEILRIVVPSEKLTEDDFEGITGQGYLAVLCVNQYGEPFEKTYTVASFVLGMELYRAEASLDGLTSRLNDIQKEFDERRFAQKLTTEALNAKNTEEQESGLEENPANSSIPLTWETIREECQLLFEKMGIATPEEIKIVIKTETKNTRQSATGAKEDAEEVVINNTTKNIQQNPPEDSQNRPQQGMFNSFYLNDLDTLIRKCDQGFPFNKALAAYLGKASDPGSRRDILKDSSAMLDLLNPVHLPSGRWPSPSKYHLMLGQQAAVSGILARIGGKEGGLVAVNGPPGTGKTTLLSDIIAEVVTRRAESICRYDKPWRIFDKKISCEKKNIFPLKQDVVQYTGIVVSSNNNSAVENITLDLPSLSKIDKKEHPGAVYFSEVIKSVFSRSNISTDPEPWGLVAGALGKKKNREQFSKAFFWGHPDKQSRGMKSILEDECKKSQNQNTVPADTEWDTAKETFLSIKRQIGERKEKLGVRYQNLQLPRRLVQLRREMQESNTRITQLQLEEKVCRVAIAVVEQDAPGILSRLLGVIGVKTQAYADWKQKQKDAHLALQENLKKQKQKQMQLQMHRDTLEQSALKAKLVLHQREEDKDLGPVPDEQFFSRSSKEQHLGNVWTTDAFDLLRSQCFIAALKVHETTIRACAGKFKANYEALNAMLTSHDNFPPEVRKVLWDTFFFTVPVASTTLASFDRLFTGMGEDSLGWLLIDEAGQATPQSVAGALWRSRRAVIIGDPLQIEPVITIPEKMVAHIQKKYMIADDWSPKLQSAQTLADRTMDVGAWVGDNVESAVWTGLPLRAHRRCMEPMFSVSNKIAYDNQMVQANTNSPIQCCIGESAWFNVEATASDGQVVKEELDELRQHLQSIQNIQKGWPKVSEGSDASIYIISPFRRVAEKCNDIVRGLKLEKKILAGTIHTFQGKEADIVFIVLGTAPGNAGAGSRNWASQKPNILNVALTRAKQLVYVIGNLEDWGECNGFNCLANNITVVPPSGGNKAQHKVKDAKTINEQRQTDPFANS
jgi:hypothetical protein